MINLEYKRAVKYLEEEYNKCKKIIEQLIKNLEGLQEVRLKAIYLIRGVEGYLNSIANKTQNFDKLIQNLNIGVENLETMSNNFKCEIDMLKKVEKSDIENFISVLAKGGVLGASILGLLGTVPFGLFSPLGIVGGVALILSKNKGGSRIVKKRIKMIKEISHRFNEVSLTVYTSKIVALDLMSEIENLLCEFITNGIYNYEEFSNAQEDKLGILINSTEGLSNNICKEI